LRSGSRSGSPGRNVLVRLVRLSFY
jgi:hypothetical protein